MTDWLPDVYLKHAGFVPALGADVLALLDPRPGERILDLGCGEGTLTAEIQSRGAVVVGVDSSPAQIAAARARGLNARVGEAERLTFDAEFDAVFSNAALHWMKNAGAVAAGVRRALKPGGRFVGEMGGHMNVAAIHVAARGVLARRGVELDTPWYYPTEDEYAALLHAHGFRVDEIRRFARPTPLPTGMSGWLAMFGGPLVGPLRESDRPDALEEIVDLLRPALCDTAGRWTADYVRLRFKATASGG